MALANKQRPDCFLHDLQPSPSPPNPVPSLRWWKITMPSRLAHWKRARLEENKGQPNQETHHWISPNHMDLKTCQTGLKLANTQENLLNATVMIHWDSLQFENDKWQWNDCIYFPQTGHNTSNCSWIKDGMKAWKQKLKNSLMLIHCRKRRGEKKWRFHLSW